MEDDKTAGPTQMQLIVARDRARLALLRIIEKNAITGNGTTTEEYSRALKNLEHGTEA